MADPVRCHCLVERRSGEVLSFGFAELCLVENDALPGVFVSKSHRDGLKAAELVMHAGRGERGLGKFLSCCG